MRYEDIEDIEIAKEDIRFFISNSIDYYIRIPSILNPQYNNNGELIYSGVDELLNSRKDEQKSLKIKDFLKMVESLTGRNFIEARRQVLEEDKRRIKELEREQEIKNNFGRDLDDDQKDAFFDSRERKQKSSYLDDYR